jgi:hypothetical protein
MGLLLHLYKKQTCMKPRKLLLSCCIAIPAIALLSATTALVDSNGKLGNSGGPGESTCSEAGCHGAGNGNGSSGGVPDNGGPGSVVLTASPAFTGGNQYVPGTTYSLTVTVSETGKSLFGFDFEALDNSGSTNTTINNAVGTITITDATHTRVGQSFGTGRVTVTHQPGGGAFANSATFKFNWTAPASGIANLYYDGNAANGDGVADALDNVYSHNLQLSPTTSTGIVALAGNSPLLELFPNPATDQFTVRFTMERAGEVDLLLYSLDGKYVKNLTGKRAPAGLFTESFSVKDLAPGCYLLKTTADGLSETRQVFVREK